MKSKLKLNKTYRLFLLIFCLYSYGIYGQNKMTYNEMENILSFNKYITIQTDSLNSIRDTTKFIGQLLDYYADVKNEYSQFIYYQKNKKNIIQLLTLVKK